MMEDTQTTREKETEKGTLTTKEKDTRKENRTRKEKERLRLEKDNQLVTTVDNQVTLHATVPRWLWAM